MFSSWEARLSGIVRATEGASILPVVDRYRWTNDFHPMLGEDSLDLLRGWGGSPPHRR
jgi:hypothetical protein